MQGDPIFKLEFPDRMDLMVAPALNSKTSSTESMLIWKKGTFSSTWETPYSRRGAVPLRSELKLT
ncbi:hypothetical protein DPMN_130921 [Dreissena polymorpha]|uniref:Uncharacterized protein n=1 Tax=Dreissena polymorpha TaxID=45954 RepID=A0A9D4JYU0_DREPO|nr:hypothetical protein DPMN_130921 [Dreissena polymorpha]